MRFPQLFPLLCLVLFCAVSISRADSAATEPSTDDPPMPAAAAPAYLAIGKGLSLQLKLVRQTVADLKLDAATGEQAAALVDDCKGKLDALIHQIQTGNYPSNKSVLAIPSDLRQARSRLYELIGPEQSKLLDEKLQSLRGQARQKIGELRNMVDDLKLSPPEQTNCESALKSADVDVEKLPSTDVSGDEYDRSRAQMNKIFGDVHDHLAAILSQQEKTELGPRFAQLARPATAPSASGT
jgi:hypothetical protein